MAEGVEAGVPADDQFVIDCLPCNAVVIIRIEKGSKEREEAVILVYREPVIDCVGISDVVIAEDDTAVSVDGYLVS